MACSCSDKIGISIGIAVLLRIVQPNNRKTFPYNSYTTEFFTIIFVFNSYRIVLISVDCLLVSIDSVLISYRILWICIHFVCNQYWIILIFVDFCDFYWFPFDFYCICIDFLSNPKNLLSFCMLSVLNWIDCCRFSIDF